MSGVKHLPLYVRGLSATGSLGSLNGKKYEWTGKGTGPNVFEGDYTFE